MVSCRTPFDYIAGKPMKFEEHCTMNLISNNVKGCTYCKFKNLEKCFYDSSLEKDVCRCNAGCEILASSQIPKDQETQKKLKLCGANVKVTVTI